jgi:putative MATE family efflux protein
LWQLVWPTVLTNLLQASVGLIDVKVVGTLGSSAVAAATTGHRLFFALQAVLMGISIGTAALAARAWGGGDRDAAGRVLRSALPLALAIALVVMVLGLGLADAFAGLFGLQGEARALAASYVRWISAFACVFAIGFVLIATLRASGDTRTPLLLGAAANVLNVVCLYLIVFGGLRFPKLGIRGAALAGGLAFTFSSGLGLALWRSGRLRVPYARSDPESAARRRAVLRIGVPASIEQLLVQAGFIAFTFIVARFFGTRALAAFGIGQQILGLTSVVGFGFSVAAATLVGQHLGANDAGLAAASGWRAMRLAVLSMSIVGALLLYFARPLAALMIDDVEVNRLTVPLLCVLGLAQPLAAIDFSLAGALRGAGDTRFPLLSTCAGLFGGRVLLAAAFTWRGLSIEWVYAALLADYAIKISLLLLRFRSGRWQRALGGVKA